MLPYERQNLLSGSSTAETPELHTLVEQDHRRKAPHAIMAGQLHVVAPIHFQLGQTDGAPGVGDDLLKQGRDNETGRTPVSPKVDENRPLGRRVEDVSLKRLPRGIEDRHVRWAHSAPKNGTTGRSVAQRLRHDHRSAKPQLACALKSYQNLPSNSSTIETTVESRTTALVLIAVCRRQYLLAAHFLNFFTVVLQRENMRIRISSLVHTILLIHNLFGQVFVNERSLSRSDRSPRPADKAPLADDPTLYSASNQRQNNGRTQVHGKR
jgi:hypothetical protein